MSKGRKSVEFWTAQDKAFWRYNRRPLRQFVKYARRLAGDKHELAYATTKDHGDGPDGEKDAPALGNLTSLAARVLRASLLWRNPRFHVKTLGGVQARVFTPLLARIETSLLNDFAEETGLYRQQRLSLMDGILGPYMVGKVTFDFDLALDADVVEKSRARAQYEDRLFITTGRGPRVRDDDYHPSHIEQHEATIAQMERGEIKVPLSAIKYLKKHVRMHREAMPWCRTSETMRNQSIHYRRINPLQFGYDVFDPDRPTWFRETFLARIEDLRADTENNRKAVEELQPIRHFYATGDDMPQVPMQYDVQTPDPLARVHEYVDLVDEQVVLIGDGGTVPLRVRPYSAARILPSGPYVVSSFLEHPLHNTGIPLPYLTEAHEDAAARMAGINTETVDRSLPMSWVNGRVISAETKAKIESGDVGATIILDQVPDGTKGDDHIGNIPPIAVPEQNVGMESYHRKMFEQHYGGSAALLGGDHSETATASEVAQLARSLQADEMGALLDDHMRRIGVYQRRYSRWLETPAQVADKFGDEALTPGGWPPEGFADRDIVTDRNIAVVPGSTRRNNSTIETKLLQDSYALKLNDPTVAPEELVETRRRLDESNGIFGIDYEASLTYAVEQAAMAAMGMGQEQGAGQGDDTMPRLAEGDEPSMSSQRSGANNVGGGRAGRGGIRSQLRKRRKDREEPGA